MKFGMTWMGRSVRNTRRVSSLSQALTEVRQSDCSIEKRVTAWNEGAWPTRVMSVPCSVVTVLIFRDPSICLAR